IADRHGFIARMGPEVNIVRNELGQLNALIARLEASEDVGEVWDTIMCLRDEQRKAKAKLADLQHWLTDAEEEIVKKQKQLKISGKHRALFSSFLGDTVREHIGLKILAWNKRYFDVDLTARKLVKSAATKMAHSKYVYQHTMGRGGYALVKEKMKETEDKIKEGTLKVDHGTDAMTVVLGKEKGGYVSLVDINPINSSTNEEGGRTVFGCENDASIQKSNGLATLEKKMEARVSNKTSPCETVKSVESKKMTRSIRKDSSLQASQSQENVSPLLAIKCKLWHLKKSTIIALGTVYKTDGKQMLHIKELPKDCYKVLIDTSLVDAACIPDVGNNGFKIVKDAVGDFFAWPKETPASTI
ncbi:hypothetical protein Tco_1221126, partial [Tanacetum coccineum]